MPRKIPEEKKYIRNRVSQIIRDYLYNEEESYCYIDMYFEKENGEHQHKRLKIGRPSDITPDRFRDFPKNFQGFDEYGGITIDKVPHKKVVWVDSNGNELNVKHDKEAL